MYKAMAPGAIGHHMPFKDAAEVTAASGFKGYWFEIWGDSKIPADETLDVLAKNKLTAAGFGLPVEFRYDGAAFEESFKQLPQLADYAAKIGANRCATWLLPSHETLTYSKNFEIHKTRLKKCAEVLSAYGITLGLEFVGPVTARKGKKYEFVHNLDQMLELCGAIGTDNIGLLLDAWHWDTAGQTPADFNKIGDQKMIALVHINDAPAGVPIDEQIDSVRKLPGATGVLKIADFFAGLRKLGYDGPVLAEPFEPSLGKMTYAEACKATMDAFNKIW